MIVLRKETIAKSTLINQLRTRCRLKNEISEATVPSWSSFHKKTCVTSAKKASASYLPGITDSPTKFSVVRFIMQRTFECMTCLNLNYKFLEVDQAIYNKVLRVLFAYQKKESRKCDKLIAHMGDFHVILCLLRTKYSRFKNLVIIELLLEAGVRTKGTIRSAIRGGDIKQGIHYHKIIYVAFTRPKINFSENSTCEESGEYKYKICNSCKNMNHDNSQIVLETTSTRRQ